MISPQAIQGIGMTSQRTRDRLVEQLQTRGIRNEAVLKVISKVPRHLFVDEALAHRAYENTALPIGHGQTISQPYIVARMTELLLAGERPLDKVLEVGTGSGYQAAVLGAFSTRLYTVERIEPLYRQARKLLRDLGYRNIQASLSDGTWGLPAQAPFDGILVTAAPQDIPAALLEQLAEGARLVIPVGTPQELRVVTALKDGHFRHETIEPVQFVPLLSDPIIHKTTNRSI
ncbi:MAG: protein-L-isoaspartate(D-aspartate) O-methyltransferase [Thiothrix sp.]|nr:protein-L-isoaspartate(D-aspartate) O-methyltransferase [Thiothrix sp.]HPQ94318.1 protein-L-isoaspartate(D-aspartate) O-methyltransferase [Thiolinea sp.]